MNAMNRSRLLNLLISLGLFGCLAATSYPVLRYLLPPEQVEAEPEALKLGAVKDFPPGSGRIFKFGRRPIILIRDLKGVFHALSAVCTHLDCIVQYSREHDLVWCACHNGKYDLSGRNISGPPPRPLEPFDVKVAGDEVTVVRKP